MKNLIDWINPGKMVILRKIIVELCHYDIATAYIITQLKNFDEDNKENGEEIEWMENNIDIWCKKLSCTKQDFIKAKKFIMKNKIFLVRTFKEKGEERVLIKIDMDLWVKFCKKGDN